MCECDNPCGLEELCQDCIEEYMARSQEGNPMKVQELYETWYDNIATEHEKLLSLAQQLSLADKHFFGPTPEPLDESITDDVLEQEKESA